MEPREENLLSCQAECENLKNLIQNLAQLLVHL